MATDGNDDAVEGSWSPRRPRKAAARSGAAKEPAAKEPTAQDPAALVSDIERTREELAETLDAIADKVSPKRVVKRTSKQVGDSVKRAADSAQEAVQTGAAATVQTVKDATEAVKDKVVGDEPGPDVSSAPVPVESIDPARTQQTVSAAELAVAPASGSKRPVYVGAAVALAVVLLVRRRRRR